MSYSPLLPICPQGEGHRRQPQQGDNPWEEDEQPWFLEYYLYFLVRNQAMHIALLCSCSTRALGKDTDSDFARF